MSVILAEVTRSEIVESIHRGDIAVVNSEGHILYKAGNHNRMYFFRSSAKPIIAIGTLETGIAEKYKLDLKEIALMTSSHSGGQEHIDVLNSIMKKTGLDESSLKCGIQSPAGIDEAIELYKSGNNPTQLHCNCSAKHIGILAAAKLMGYTLDDYTELDHPIQKKIVEVISHFSNYDITKIKIGVDGCSIPVFCIPLKNIAAAYANLCNNSFMERKYVKSQNYIVSAMSMYPEMVAGKGRIETELMKRFGDRIIVKSGAEGMFCGGIPEKGIGIAIKIEDGAARAAGPVFMEVLIQIGILKRDELDGLQNFWNTPIKTNAGRTVGLIRPKLRLTQTIT